MTTIQTRVRRWGNSLGVIIPSEAVASEKIRENDEIMVLLVKDSKRVLRETFGMLKGKIKKSSQQIKDELRVELYD